MKRFIPVEFNNLVKNQKEQMVHITSNSQAKLVIIQVIKDNGYDPMEVYNYLINLWEETYPYFREPFNKYDWAKAFNHYIKQAEEEYDWEVAKIFRNELMTVSAKGKEKNEQLRKKFFHVIKETGRNPKLMEMDMCLDFWGWIYTLDRLIYGAEWESLTKTVYETSVRKTKEKEGIKVKEPKSIGKAKKEKDESSKTRKRTKYLEIQQWSLEGELIKGWNSISEVSKTHGFNHASISKCISGAYKTAEGYVWKGITDPKELSSKFEIKGKVLSVAS